MLDKIIAFFKKQKELFMEGYYDGQIKSTNIKLSGIKKYNKLRRKNK